MVLNQTCPLFIYLFIFARKSGKEEKKKKVTAVVVMRSRRGCCWECHTAFGHSSRAWPWGSLSSFSSAGLEGVSGEHSSWSCAFHQPATHSAHREKHTSRKQSKVVNSSQVPQEDMDWGHGSYSRGTRKEWGSWSLQIVNDPVAFHQKARHQK